MQGSGAVKVVSQTTQQGAMALLSHGSVAGIVVIPSGFSAGQDSNVYLYLDNSQPQSTEIVSATVDETAAQAGASPVTSSVNGGGRSIVSVVSNYVFGAKSNYLSFVVGGLIVMVASFGAIFSAGFTLLSDRELGNLKAFLITPINKFSVLLSKIAYGTFQSLLSAYIGLAIGLLYGATIGAGVIGLIELIWIVFLVGLGCGGLAGVLAPIGKLFQTDALVGQTVAMPLAFLGGAFVPANLLPNFLMPIVEVNPVTYAVNAVRDIMIKGVLPLNTLISTSMILAAFTGVMMLFAYLLFRNAGENL
jgi:ABC-2 type transport system permease protein